MSFFPLLDVLNLVMYPDRHADQSSSGVRHKALLSLKGFSGLQVLNKMDKHFNVIVIITTEEVIPLSFETIDQRAEWLALLQGHFGKGESESMMLITGIGHFRITSGLVFEASLGAHLFICKTIFIHMKMSLICM